MADYSLRTLTAYVRPDTAGTFKRRARSLGLSSSAYLKQLIERELAGSGDVQMLTLTRHVTFLSVAMDALLSEHPDPTLRARVHQVFQRKIQPQETADDV